MTPPTPLPDGLSSIEERCEAEGYESLAREALSNLEASRNPDRRRINEFIWQYHEWMPIARIIAKAVREASSLPKGGVTEPPRVTLVLGEKFKVTQCIHPSGCGACSGGVHCDACCTADFDRAAFATSAPPTQALPAAICDAELTADDQWCPQCGEPREACTCAAALPTEMEARVEEIRARLADEHYGYYDISQVKRDIRTLLTALDELRGKEGK